MLAKRAGLSVYGIQKLEREISHPYRDTPRRLVLPLQLAPEPRPASGSLSGPCGSDALLRGMCDIDVG
ncbi:MAG: hypothetical protein M3069_02610 [Chloroflexota bacterium]|nr:hypothetical protein [Chloroflexota bacterium]